MGISGEVIDLISKGHIEDAWKCYSETCYWRGNNECRKQMEQCIDICILSNLTHKALGAKDSVFESHIDFVKDWLKQRTTDQPDY